METTILPAVCTIIDCGGYIFLFSNMGNRIDWQPNGFFSTGHYNDFSARNSFDTRYAIYHSSYICLFVSVRIRRISIQTGIHGGVNKRRGKQWGRNLMLGIQFFICWIFVSFTVALFLQSEKTTQTLFHTLNQKKKKRFLAFH